MPRNGAGTFSYTEAPVVSGTPVSAAVENSRNTDIADAITASIAKDGQTTATADLPMGAFKHLNVGNAVLRTQYLSAGQAQDGAVIWGGTATYTTASNVYAITLSPAMASYAAGQTFTWVASNANVGSNAELNVNGAGKKDLKTADGRTMRGGEIRAGVVQRATYNGTEFRMLPVAAEEMIESITASNSTSVDFNLPSGYRAFNLYFDAVVPDATSGYSLLMYTSVDGGSSYNSNYAQTYVRGPSTEATATAYTDASLSQFFLTQDTSPASNSNMGMAGKVLIYPGTSPATKTPMAFAQTTTLAGLGSGPITHDAVGRVGFGLIRLNRLRIQFISGVVLIKSGVFTLTGLRG